jgi:hypothetical protein
MVQRGYDFEVVTSLVNVGLNFAGTTFVLCVAWISASHVQPKWQGSDLGAASFALLQGLWECHRLDIVACPNAEKKEKKKKQLNLWC